MHVTSGVSALEPFEHHIFMLNRTGFVGGPI